ncbi:hypothetical protein [Roseateles aquatilis]|uniref:hypothetical protein n=1 Tax=Roseateles aquatilis TaxID=431061 RepID=UPI001131C783|nr:hypothetical protein [Roseateles aquatilis]
MNPRDIAKRLTRPMSTEEATRLVLERQGAREVADIDPQMETELREMKERIELGERARQTKGKPY